MPNPLKDNLLNKILIKNLITGIVANCYEIGNSLTQNTKTWFPLKKLFVIYNGVDSSNLKIPDKFYYTKEKNEIVLGHAGRFVEQKGHKYLIELAKCLKSQHINFKILLAGTGPLENDIRQLITSEKLNDSFVFLGHLNDMHNFFNSIDFFVFPSLWEGAANTLIEAMAYRKLCFVFNISSMPEMVKDQETGIVTEVGDVENMAKEIIHLTKNPDKLNKLVDNAFKQVAERFDYKDNLKKYLELLAPN